MEGNSSSKAPIIVQNYYCMPPAGLPPQAAAAAAAAQLQQMQQQGGVLSNRAAPQSSTGHWQHFHRIAGDCGLNQIAGDCEHRPILHNPPGGVPHIDFVVDGKVECYQGNLGFQLGAAGEGRGPAGAEGECRQVIRPRQYSCHESTCTDRKLGGEAPCQQPVHVLLQKPPGDPKEFDLGDIDLDGAEWNETFFEPTKEGGFAPAGAGADPPPAASTPGWHDRSRGRGEAGGSSEHPRMSSSRPP